MMLHETYDVLSKNGIITEELISNFVRSNLPDRFPLRPYQIEAMSRFSYALSDRTNLGFPLHLLFHMATGSGKTLIMASNILQLYEKGYRRFLFVVNSKEIVRKTKENFLNSSSQKHLFKSSIINNGKRVQVRSIENFDEVDEDSINIVFTTIQGLREKILVPRENSLTFDDFEKNKVVILSDEAHHFSASTKGEKEDLDTWENVIQTILESHNDNILLEYTATAEVDNEVIKEKYKNKIIYNYNLRAFRKDRYSKEVKVLQSEVNNMERILQSLIVSQYRKKVSEKYGIVLFKPVILVKTKSKENAEETYENFKHLLSHLDGSQIKKIYPDDNEDHLLNKAFKFFKEESIDYNNLAAELKMDFSLEKQMIIYSGNDAEEKQILLNNLEEKGNPIRIIFIVKKLTEGWDVLNLYDIVRTDENPNGGKTPTQDAQLIGRGARYFPFSIGDEHSKFQRKYDEDINHPLRALEELYYYSVNHPNYIRSLHKQLDKLGLGNGEKEKVKLELKQSFKDNNLYKQGYIFLNKQERVDRKKFNSFNDLGLDKKFYDVRLKSMSVSEVNILEEKIDLQVAELDRDFISLSSIPFSIVRKALQKDSFYYLRNLKTYLPNVTSINQFIESKDYLGQITISLSRKKGDRIDLNPEEWLYVVIKMLEELKGDIEKNASTFIGTKEFYPRGIKELPFEKEMNIILDEDKRREQSTSTTDDEQRKVKVEEKKWYVYQKAYRNTSEEQLLIRLISDMYENQKDEFTQFYLIRNEKLFKVYRFSDGKGFEPDFLIIAKRKENEDEVIYQIFVEPKGEHLKEHDKEKEVFLREIIEMAELYIEKDKKMLFYDSNDYRIFGLPFFNQKTERAFKEELENIFE